MTIPITATLSTLLRGLRLASYPFHFPIPLQLQLPEYIPVFPARNTNKIAFFYGNTWCPLINPIASSTGRNILDKFVSIVQLNRDITIKIIPPQY
ncbi:hypothetical protein [Nostoc sp.]|uniref:hypothetical protein n=1 Tax=Nostoc sp. TaxID=1180 RepID=UPI002FFA5552